MKSNKIKKSTFITVLAGVFVMACIFTFTFLPERNDSKQSFLIRPSDANDFLKTNLVFSSWTITSQRTSQFQENCLSLVDRIKNFKANLMSRNKKLMIGFETRAEDYCFQNGNKSIVISVGIKNEIVRYFLILTKDKNSDIARDWKYALLNKWKYAAVSLQLD